MVPAFEPAASVSKRRRVARVISIVGHPMVVIPGAVALALRAQATAMQAATSLAVVVGAILIVGAYLVHGVRTGRLSHIDVSNREERSGFYRVSMLALGVGAVVLHLTHAPPGAARGTGIACGLVVVSSIVNRWIKASLHTAFAIVAVGIVGIGTGNLLLVAGFLVAAAAVGWSRIVLDRHSPAEVAVGAVLGTLAAAAAVLIG